MKATLCEPTFTWLICAAGPVIGSSVGCSGAGGAARGGHRAMYQPMLPGVGGGPAGIGRATDGFGWAAEGEADTRGALVCGAATCAVGVAGPEQPAAAKAVSVIAHAPRRRRFGRNEF